MQDVPRFLVLDRIFSKKGAHCTDYSLRRDAGFFLDALSFFPFHTHINLLAGVVIFFGATHFLKSEGYSPLTRLVSADLSSSIQSPSARSTIHTDLAEYADRRK